MRILWILVCSRRCSPIKLCHGGHALPLAPNSFQNWRIPVHAHGTRIQTKCSPCKRRCHDHAFLVVTRNARWYVVYAVIHGIALCGWCTVCERYALYTVHRLQTARVNDNDVLYCVFVADFRLNFATNSQWMWSSQCSKSQYYAPELDDLSTSTDLFDTGEQRGTMSRRRRERVRELICLTRRNQSIGFSYISDEMTVSAAGCGQYIGSNDDRFNEPDVIFNWTLLVYALDMALGEINTKHHIHRSPHFYQNYHDY